jgi:hypothetical protein
VKNGVKLLIFICLFIVSYVLVLIVLCKWQYNGKQFLQQITNYNVYAGGTGQTLRRFRDIDNASNIDILFLGSSHTYRGFDPRIFASHGYTSFNMGSTSQTPLNTYYLLKKYFRQLHPKLVVLEVYPLLLSKDGIESFYDLVTNSPISYEMTEMALALKNPHAVHILVKNGLERLRTPLLTINQNEIPNENYIPGGYCETKLTKNKSEFLKERTTVAVSETQLTYLIKIIHLLDKSQIKLVIVTQPLPREYCETISNYNDITNKISLLAKDHQVLYIDYNNKKVDFNTNTDFYDKDHLTSAGVIKYNKLLINDLIANNLII